MTERAKRIPAVPVLVLLLAALAGAACSAAGQVRRGASGPEAPTLSEGPVSAEAEARAEALLASARRAYALGDMATARERAEEIVEAFGETPASVPALLIAARASYAQGDYAAAEAMAERYAALFPPETEEAREADALIARARATRREERERVVRLGVILPLSGSPYLKQYGEVVLDGVRLAEEEHVQSGGRAVELVVRDNQGSAERTAALVRELEREGVVGIVGPLLDASVAAAARARRDTALAIVTPTAMNVTGRFPNVYSLNVADTRGAAALAEYALRAGLRRVATLYPGTREFRRQARVFEGVFEGGGGEVVLTVPYDSGTTTFTEQLDTIAARLPEAIYVPAPPRDVRQIAPQVAYTGLDTLGVAVLGGRAWASDGVRRLVGARFLEGVVASAAVEPSGTDYGREGFVALYENTYRRTLDNRFPALGYDAVRLFLAALAAGRADAGSVGRRLGMLAGVEGATGILSVEAGVVARRPFLVRIQDGVAVDAPPPELLELEPATEPADSLSRG